MACGAWPRLGRRCRRAVRVEAGAPQKAACRQTAGVSRRPARRYGTRLCPCRQRCIVSPSSPSAVRVPRATAPSRSSVSPLGSSSRRVPEPLWPRRVGSRPRRSTVSPPCPLGKVRTLASPLAAQCSAGLSGQGINRIDLAKTVAKRMSGRTASVAAGAAARAPPAGQPGAEPKEADHGRPYRLQEGHLLRSPLIVSQGLAK